MSRTLPSSAHRLIDPKALAAISDLQLVARTVVDGFMFGEHRSNLAGAGIEFNQYRSYQPGDDPRRVDWKLYARSDRYYVREAEVETSINVRFVLDTSASMALGQDYPKFDYARMVIAAIAYLAAGQGDAVGLYSFGENLVSLRPRQGQLNLVRLLHALEDLVPSGRWPEWNELEGALDLSGSRELILLVTDLVEHSSEIMDAASRLNQFRNEVVVVHVGGESELSDVSGPLELEDAESGERLIVDAGAAKRHMEMAWADHLEMLKAALANEGTGYWYLDMRDPLDSSLRSFLSHRAHQG